MDQNVKTLKDKIQDAIRHSQPITWISVGFVGIILLGTLFLWLPISNRTLNAGFLNHLFVATSASCVTGLTTVNILGQYTIFGQIVLLALIQIGGLGVMTVLAFLMSSFKYSFSLDEKKLMQESLGKGSITNVPEFLLRVIKYTAIMEGAGVVLLYIRFFSIGPIKGLWYAIFHSVSAFCNAGIDLFGDTSLLVFQGDLLINITVMLLIICGGLGFAVWFELSDNLQRRKKGYSFHARLVLTLTIGLIVSGMVLFLLLEWNHALAGMSVGKKLLVSLFQSVTLRTAGFSTINCGILQPATKLMMVFYMIIGGSPGGTAGGMKTTTFFILLLHFVNVTSNGKELVWKKRSIRNESRNKAVYLMQMYLVFLILGVFLILAFEPMDFMDLVFEAASAIGTVGLSAGLTSTFGVMGKVIIILLMFMGRVGPLSVFAMLVHKKNPTDLKYPPCDFLIG